MELSLKYITENKIFKDICDTHYIYNVIRYQCQKKLSQIKNVSNLTVHSHGCKYYTLYFYVDYQL